MIADDFEYTPCDCDKDDKDDRDLDELTQEEKDNCNNIIIAGLNFTKYFTQSGCPPTCFLCFRTTETSVGTIKLPPGIHLRYWDISEFLPRTMKGKKTPAVPILVCTECFCRDKDECTDECYAEWIELIKVRCGCFKSIGQPGSLTKLDFIESMEEEFTSSD